MRQRGTVIEKTKEQLRVKIENPNEVCDSCGGCVRLTPSRPQEDHVISLKQSPGGFDVGDSVIIESENKNLIRAVAVLYGVPFVTLFVGYALTRWMSGHDALGGIGAIIGLLAGALAARLYTRRLLKNEPNFKIIARACQ